MLTTYFRSSSYNNYDFCQMQYFISYILGHTAPANQKADKGTIVHKVLECLANVKLAIQNDPNANSYKDDHIGEVCFNPETILEPQFLTPDEIRGINKSRVNKSNYKVACQLKDGHHRKGVELVNHIFERVYDYYTHKDRTPHKWMPVDRKDCDNWVWMALDYRGGLFDPRKRDIFAAEPHFDIEIDRPWAKYDYTLPDGKRISGNLAIKGTVDLITRLDDGILEVVDWKTGQRLDWAKGGVKTYERLCNDPQLMLYYYALRNLYPEVTDIILTIFFIRDGGPFSICFDDRHLARMEKMLEQRYLEVRNNVNPKQCDPTQQNFKCAKLCPFYKNKFPGEIRNMCTHIKNEIEEKGIDYVTREYTKAGHSVDNYNAPGGE